VTGIAYQPDDTFAAVSGTDGWNVFRIVGWRYDPANDTSKPVVITRGLGMHTLAPGPYVIAPRWPGIRFGSHVNHYRSNEPSSDDLGRSIPLAVKEEAKAAGARWLEHELASLRG
jgi:hypothetical protein